MYNVYMSICVYVCACMHVLIVCVFCGVNDVYIKILWLQP